MPIPSLTDSQIDRDSPLDEAVMKTGLKDRDDWLWSEATNGGSGIAPNATAFQTAFAGHSHDGTDGEGANIDTPGIANGAASQEEMFTDNCVSTAKIAANTLTGPDFDTAAVTTGKMSGTMGYTGGALSGSQSYDTTLPPSGDSENFLGDRKSITNPKGSPGVICKIMRTASPQTPAANRMDCWIVSQSGSTILIGFDYDSSIHDASGTWNYDFSVV